jgi:serine/threonine protein kinase
MGEVYLAHDTRLDRKVALKVLTPELAATQDRLRRFITEAKAAAGLHHPNIAHIYEIGDVTESAVNCERPISVSANQSILPLKSRRLCL